eukprot:Gb_25986 [translate_table: standard]
MERLSDREIKISVTWRGKTLELMEKSGSTVGELGNKLLELTNILPDTMRLLVPHSRHSAPVSLVPFSDQHCKLSLDETGISEGRAIRMMGVFSAEVEEVTHSATKSDNRIPGFLEEERRANQRIANGLEIPRKLPQGPYVFCAFRTLQLPGIELNPPAAKALEIMHMLARDLGIVAIMNKHHWRVGIMTELAPVGYVGISPKCLLGFNKNHGEEISLRLRTDDLKGFRKYDSIKKTLLHELAHMVHSEHDANFFALDKQLNQEAVALDWTKSSSRTLSGSRQTVSGDEVISFHKSQNVHQLGGNPLHSSIDARASAAAAALLRVGYSPPTNTSSVTQEEAGKQVTDYPGGSIVLSINKDEPDPDDCSAVSANPNIRYLNDASMGLEQALSEPDPDDRESYDYITGKPDLGEKMWEEPDPDDCQEGHSSPKPEIIAEPDPDDCQEGHNNPKPEIIAEPDPDDCRESKTMSEPDPDDSIREYPDTSNMPSRTVKDIHSVSSVHVAPELNDGGPVESDFAGNYKVEIKSTVSASMFAGVSGKERDEPDPDDSMETASYGGSANGSPEIEMHDGSAVCGLINNIVTADGDIQWPVDDEDPDLRRIQESTSATCVRLQQAIERLKHEAAPVETTSVIQTLFTILRNVLDHPNEAKFKRLRKANPTFQRRIAKYEAALEVLFAVGFSEDIASDEIGMGEAYLVLKRNDPGLLWLARSSLEICIAAR